MNDIDHCCKYLLMIIYKEHEEIVPAVLGSIVS